MEGFLHPKSIVILDYGGQYAHLIASRVRRFGVFTEIREPETSIDILKDAAGIILSGGPQSVYDEGSPQADPKIFELGVPVLGICYGLHWMTQILGGEVKQGKVKEYGQMKLRIENDKLKITKGLPGEITVWMSHGDEAIRLPEGFERFGTSDSCANAAFSDEDRNFFAIQFHPEVTHTEHGGDILRRFTALCDAAPWSIESYSAEVSQQIKKEVGDHKVFMLVSGGVDSSVAFKLLNDVLGTDRVQGLIVDTGLMRKGEVPLVMQAFKDLGIENLRAEDASAEFFANLEEVYEPEEKRRVIGETFLSVQKRVSEEMGLSMEAGWMLGQGTIYPDTIETGATKHSDKIKTHHNRVEAVQKMIDAGLVIEPLKDLYKDEVRELGEELGLPHEFVWRHPFPGPGLGVRILCASESSLPEGEYAIDVPHMALPIQSVGVQGDGRSYRHAVALFSGQPTVVTAEMQELATKIPNATPLYNRVLLCTSQSDASSLNFVPGHITPERAALLQEADAIADEEMKAAGLYEEIWQFPVVLLPFGANEGGQSIVLRPIASIDAMSASAVALPSDVLRRMTERIMKIDGIDLVFLDLTNKPPGTIEWE
jgi:GMP synthase (glutamine-hydrolysing)